MTRVIVERVSEVGGEYVVHGHEADMDLLIPFQASTFKPLVAALCERHIKSAIPLEITWFDRRGPLGQSRGKRIVDVRSTAQVPIPSVKHNPYADKRKNPAATSLVCDGSFAQMYLVVRPYDKRVSWTSSSQYATPMTLEKASWFVEILKLRDLEDARRSENAYVMDDPYARDANDIGIAVRAS